MMSLELSIKEHAAALLELAAAIRAAGLGASTDITAKTGEKTVTKNADKPEVKQADDDENGGAGGGDDVIYWLDNKAGTFGKVDSQADYDKLKKKNANMVKTTENGYNKKVKEAEAKAAEAAKSNKGKGKGKGDEVPEVTKDQLAKTFQAFLPKDLDDDEKETRREFVKGLLDRFGGAKVTEMPEEHWGLAVNLVTRKMNGEDIDPEDAEYEAVSEDDMI